MIEKNPNDLILNILAASCPAGQQLSTGCTPCPAGKYKATADASLCLDCPAGKTSSQGATSCKQGTQFLLIENN